MYSCIVNILKRFWVICLLKIFGENRNDSDKIVILSLKVKISPDVLKWLNNSCTRRQFSDSLFSLSKCKL